MGSKNLFLGKFGYSTMKREDNPARFSEIMLSAFGKDDLEVHALVLGGTSQISKDSVGLIRLHVEDFYYVVSESGSTIENLSLSKVERERYWSLSFGDDSKELQINRDNDDSGCKN